ncbi:MAG TPA: hypothetical protein VMF89_26000 [Polyangiales bacterium]|nr:hypothetical protein [Polyangiales bacterium]
MAPAVTGTLVLVLVLGAAAVAPSELAGLGSFPQPPSRHPQPAAISCQSTPTEPA